MTIMKTLFGRETVTATIVFGAIFMALGLWQLLFNSRGAGILLIIFAALVLATGLGMAAKRKRDQNKKPSETELGN